VSDNGLVVLSKARKHLAEAKTLLEVKAIRDQGHAAIKWAKQQRDIGFEAQVDAAEITLRAERRLGEMLAGMEKQHGARPADTGSHDVTPLSLSDHGITKMQSSRWQAEARVEEDAFDDWVRECREAKKLPTQSALIKLSRQQPEQTTIIDIPPDSDSRVVASLDELADCEPFQCLYADPPWRYGNQGTRAATDNHYTTMTVDKICAEPVANLAADNAHLHLWTTNGFLFDAKRVMEAWGFTYKSCLVWVKPQMGIGNYWRVSHEFLLFGIRGRLPFGDRGQMSWVQADREKHSKKPHVFREIIERVSPGPRLELYGRSIVPGWTVYGNQISETLFDGKAEEHLAPVR
jgi:N6-adenosine-specific RNA methylase IME4